jgi:hypothetical protein
VKLEHLAQDLKDTRARLIEIKPEEAAARKQFLDRPTAEVPLTSAALLDDVAGRRAVPERCAN